MSFSRKQKIGIVFFLCTLLPAYLIANWRHDANLSAISNKFEREQQLHVSIDKLVNSCERNEEKENDHYSPNHQICEQGLKEQTSTAHAMEVLTQEKQNNDTQWYRNFFLSVSVLNLLGLLIYQGNTVLKRQDV